jgi:D-xylose transport system substrate-binding protein
MGRLARASATCTKRSSREDRRHRRGPLKGGPLDSVQFSCGEGSQSWTAPTTVPPSRVAQLLTLIVTSQEEETRVFIRKTVALIAIAAIALAACSGPAATTGPTTGAGSTTPAGTTAAVACKVGVAWATSQEERYKLRDEPAVKGAIEAGGGTYISGGDAQNKAEIQATQIATLLASNINVLVINAVNPVTVLTSLKAALDAGIPVIAYDRELESTKALFLTHDNVLVGNMIAAAVTKVQPTGNYVIIKGDKTETNPIFLRNGMEQVLKPLVDSNAIKIVAEEFTPNWKAEAAQTEMENILTAHPDIQGVLSENDNMATGITAALPGKNADGKIKIGAQDGDTFALNRVALGTQVVSVWKNSIELGTAAGKAALELCKDPDISKVTGAKASKTTGGLDAYSLLLNPVPITKDNLQVVLDAKWITKDVLCKGVTAGSVPGC